MSFISIPMFPSLKPKPVDTLWFSVDSPIDEENDISVLEQEHQTNVDTIAQRHHDMVPLGKTFSEDLNDTDDDEEDDDNDDDDDTDSRDEEDEEDLDMEISYDRNSPVDVNIRMVQGPGHGVR